MVQPVFMICHFLKLVTAPDLHGILVSGNTVGILVPKRLTMKHGFHVLDRCCFTLNKQAWSTVHDLKQHVDL